MFMRGIACKSLNETTAFPLAESSGRLLPYALFNRFPSGSHDFLSLIVRSQLTSGVLIVTYRGSVSLANHKPTTL